MQLSPQGGHDAQRTEKIGRHRHCLDPLHRVAADQHPVGSAAVSDGGYKRSAMLLPELEFRHGELTLGPGLLDTHEPASVGIRKRVQQDRMYNAVDGSVGADSKRKRKYRDDRECRAPTQGAQGVAQVLPQRLEKSDAIHSIPPWFR